MRRRPRGGSDGGGPATRVAAVIWPVVPPAAAPAAPITRVVPPVPSIAARASARARLISSAVR